MVSNTQAYIGLDTHKKFIVGFGKEKDGKLIHKQKFDNDPHAMRLFLAHFPRDSKIALESSSCWQYTFDYLVDMGYEVCLSNPSKTRLIGESSKKTDWEDAEKLSDLLRMNMLPLSYAAPKHIRMQRQITRHRLSIVNMRKQLKNKIHAILRRHGIKTEMDDLFTQKGIEFLLSIDLPMCDRFEVDQYIGLLRHMNAKINETQERIEEISSDDPQARLLMTHPGIAHYSALMISAETGDINRFSSGKKLVSFAGLNPRVSQSGERCYMGRISKEGSRNLRWILIQCANITIRTDKRLKSFYLKKRLGKGHNKAIVAVARKMLINMYVMMKHRITYHALRVNKAS